MNIEIKIPPLGESVSEAVIAKILKPSGTLVAQDEEILEIETDKVNQVLYAPKAGVIQLKVKEGDTVKVGGIIAFIEEGAVPSPPKPAPKLQESQAPALEGARTTTSSFVAEIKTPSSPAPKTPLPSPSTPIKGQRKKMSNLRRVIASRLVAAKNETAMLTTFNEVDMQAVMAIREKEKETFIKKYGVKLGFMSFFIKAVVSGLKAIPEINSYIDGDEIVSLASYDMSVAVSTERGLMVPTLKNADVLNFGQIEVELEKLARGAREGTLSVDMLKGGSFTITNGGVFGSLLSTPILNPPQSAILGMHSIVKRPIAVNDQVVIRPMMYLALSYDHRVVDGKEAVLFLVHIKNQLEDPSRLLLEL
jgi:2-oxoglutarate dehydrogenase E2 component (dihydrolipoamide succinyltransferase)